MSQLLPLPWFLSIKRPGWLWYIRESLLVVGSICLLTLLFFFVPFSQLITDRLFIYLLLVLFFAAFRGFYTASLASLLSFVTFDYIFVVPQFSFQAAKFEDVLSLIVFLLSSLLTSYLASALHRQIEKERQKEREARLLYQLAQTMNRQDTLEKQLTLFAAYFVDVFRSFGLLDCSFLLFDQKKELRPVINKLSTTDPDYFTPGSDEKVALNWVTEQRQSIALYEPSQSMPSSHKIRFFRKRALYSGTCVQLVPLQIDGRVLGILRLNLYVQPETKKDPFWPIIGISTAPSHLFASTLLEQVVTLIQQEHLRQERVQLQVFQQTEKMRSALVTSVSHDLRRPLTIIKAAANTIAHQQVDYSTSAYSPQDSSQNLLSTIEREVDWLDGLIENLLDMSRVEAGGLRPQKSWYIIDILLHDVLLRMTPSLQDRLVQLTLPEKLPPIKIDSVLIEQVMTNLLTNAICYTPPLSPLEIRVVCEKERLVISVLDRGPGIPDGEEEHIFEKFYRLARSTSDPSSSTGLGLGLSICRGIIEAHQGHIWAENRSDKGAIFSFTLPLEDK